jgi:hypothetical protein
MKRNRKIIPLESGISPGMTYTQLVLAWEELEGRLAPDLHAAVKQMIDDSVRLTWISESQTSCRAMRTGGWSLLQGPVQISASADLRVAIDLAMRKQPEKSA